MKQYDFQHEDDERIASDVHEHHLKVFYGLKSLWGRYIRRLLFHSPWSSCPSIGIEVGQPMDLDDEKWAEADKHKLKDTIAKIKEEGFEFNDEDVVEISSS